MTMDDGCDMVHLLHSQRTEKLSGVFGGTEETTTGVIRLKAMAADGALKYPVIAVNEALTKHLFDNRYGTGQSTLRRDHPGDQHPDRRPGLRRRRLRLVQPRHRQPGARHGRQRDRHRNRPAAGA